MERQIKEYVSDAYGWAPVSSMKEPKAMDGENHSVLLKTGQYSDFTVRCGGKEWRLHRAIVCPKSRFFEKALEGGFEEAATGIINLREDDPAIFAHLVNYFYTLRYSEHDSAGRGSILCRFPSLTAQPLTSRELLYAHCERDIFAAEIRAFVEEPGHLKRIFNVMSRTMVMNIQVYIMADKYEVSGLKTLAHERFAKQIHTCQGPVWSHFKDYTIQSIVFFVIQSTQSNNKDIRETVTNMCARNIDQITRGEDWAAVFKEDADFTWDVLRRAIELSQDDKEAITTRWVEYALQTSSDKDRTTEAAIAGVKREFTAYKERTGRLLRAIAKQQCEACGTMFHLEIQTSLGDPHDYYVRCHACLYKYTGI